MFTASHHGFHFIGIKSILTSVLLGKSPSIWPTAGGEFIFVPVSVSKKRDFTRLTLLSSISVNISDKDSHLTWQATLYHRDPCSVSYFAVDMNSRSRTDKPVYLVLASTYSATEMIQSTFVISTQATYLGLLRMISGSDYLTRFTDLSPRLTSLVRICNSVTN